MLPQDKVAILAYNRATDFTTDHASLVPILERYKKAHEDIEVRLALHFSGLAGLYRPPGIPDFLQARVDGIFDAPGAAGVRTMPLESNARDRTDADYRRRVASALIGDPSASLSDKAEADVEGLSFDAFVGTSAKEGLDIGNINAGINYLRHVDGEKHLIYVAYGGFKTSGFVGTLDGVARAASHARVALDIVHTGGIEYRGYFRAASDHRLQNGHWNRPLRRLSLWRDDDRERPDGAESRQGDRRCVQRQPLSNGGRRLRLDGRRCALSIYPRLLFFAS